MNEENINLKLPWRFIITATGGVVLDSERREIAFCDRDGVEKMRAAIDFLNQQAKEVRHGDMEDRADRLVKGDH